MADKFSLETDRDWKSLLKKAEPHDFVPGGLGDDHASPVPLVWLSRLRSTAVLKKEKSWLARDGLVPLIHFFKDQPRPPAGFTGRVLIHEDWGHFVPRAWRPRCAGYRLTPLPTTREQLSPAPTPRRWVTIARVCRQFCSSPHLRATLAALPRRHDLLTGYFEVGDVTAEYLFEFFGAFRDGFSGKVDHAELFQLRHVTDLRDATVLDLNERLVCADDANLHLLLSRGASLPASPPRRAEETLRVSAYHGYAVSKLAQGADFWTDPESAEFLGFLRSMEVVHPGQRKIDIPPWIWQVARAGAGAR